MLNPEIKIPIVIISTILPGANPQDVESLLTIPIEDSVASVDKVKTVSSRKYGTDNNDRDFNFWI